MYGIINDADNSVYKTAADRDSAFKALNELTVRHVDGHVMNCASEQEAADYCASRAENA